MANYIKLFSIALLVSSAAQVSAMDFSDEAKSLATLRALKAAGQMPATGSDVVLLAKGALKGHEAARLWAAIQAEAPLSSSGGGSVDISAFTDFLDVAQTSVNPYPALAFAPAAKKLAADVLAAHATSWDEIKKLDAFKDLKPANIAALSHVVSSVLTDADLKTSFGNVATGRSPVGAFAADSDILTQASLTNPYSTLAALIERRYNANIRAKSYHDGSPAGHPVYADEDLPRAVIAKLSDETAMHAYIVALTS